MSLNEIRPDRRGALARLAALTAGATLLPRRPLAATNGKTWTVQTLRRFVFADGVRPVGELVFGPDGKLYGIEAVGSEFFVGSVFRWSPSDGSYELLRALGATQSEPAEPESGLIVGRDGRLWGTSLFGGVQQQGTIYSMDTDGSLRTEASFANRGAGYRPLGALVEGKKGRFYGANAGAVYAFDARSGALQSLHAFDAFKDGGGSLARLTLADDGLLYGTNQQGGAFGDGTVFRLATDGSGFQVLKAFRGDLDGQGPDSALTPARDGWLYGCASRGGRHGNGVIYRLLPDGSAFEVMHHFKGGADDGAFPRSTLVPGPDGALYGCAQEGAAEPAGQGCVFRLSRKGRLSLIHHFTEFGADGHSPEGALTFGPDGNLYGTTQAGSLGFGALYRLMPPA